MTTTLADYAEALEPRPVAPSWLVRTATGLQFSTTPDREVADRRAAKIGGTVEWYTPVQSTYWQGTESNYDH